MSWLRARWVVVVGTLAAAGGGSDLAFGGNKVDPAALMDALEAEIRALPEPPSRMVQAAEAVRTALTELQRRAAEAEQASVAAYARMASYTGAMLSREQKKVGTSSRLIEITKRTGRAGEVERYEDRHRMLLATIDRIARHYAQIVEHLAGLEPDLVEAGFRAHEEYLIEEGLAEQILVQQKVEDHVRACRTSRNPQLETWVVELGAL